MHSQGCKRAWMNSWMSSWLCHIPFTRMHIKAQMHTDIHAQVLLDEARWCNPLVFSAFHIFSPAALGLELPVQSDFGPLSSDDARCMAARLVGEAGMLQIDSMLAGSAHGTSLIHSSGPGKRPDNRDWFRDVSWDVWWECLFGGNQSCLETMETSRRISGIN